MNSDLVICTGDIAVDPQESVYRQLGKSVADMDVDAVFLPGAQDDRSRFHSSFGRRYRIDSPYSFLDRLVRVCGLPLLLIDSAEETLAERQVLWLESQLHELHRAVARGESTREVLVFSYRSLLPMTVETGYRKPISNAKEVEEIFAAYRAGHDRLEISVFSGGWSGQGPHEPAGLYRYGTPPLGRSDAADEEPSAHEKIDRPGTPGAIRLISITPGEPLETVLVYPAAMTDEGDADARNENDR